LSDEDEFKFCWLLGRQVAGFAPFGILSAYSVEIYPFMPLK